MYDNSLGRWFNIDPKAEEHFELNVFNYCSNNPLVRIDLDGCLDNPIYNIWGEFLGTDDLGLQGDPIIMFDFLFEQNMSHKTATSYNLGISWLQDFSSLIRFATHFASLPSRPDWDGYLTKEEADNWWLRKTGEALFVDQSKIKLPRITTATFNNVAGNHLYHNFIWNLDDTGKVYGTLKLTLLDADNGIVYLGSKNFMDKYDFNMDGRFFRDIATWIGRPGKANAGKSFLIYGYGYAKIPVRK